MIVCFGCPLALLARLVWPIFRIRFGEVDGGRIGHLIGSCELYICQNKLGYFDNVADFFYFGNKPVNLAVVKLFRKNMCFLSAVKYIGQANSRLFPNNPNTVTLSGRDTENLYGRVGSSVILEPILKPGDRKWLETNNIQSTRPVVLFANRDKAYLKKKDGLIDSSYHDFRNCSVSDFLPMAQAMAERGYMAIRMGTEVEHALNSNEPLIFDYPNSDVTDERDLYFASQCKFFIGTTSGISDLARLYRKPLALVNSAPFLWMTTLKSDGTSLWIPKPLWDLSENRYLTLSQIISKNLGMLHRTKDYEELGIKVIDNTPEEILNVAIEMDQMVDGTLTVSSEEEKLLEKFWNLALNGNSRNGQAQISKSFLMQHSDWIL